MKTIGLSYLPGSTSSETTTWTGIGDVVVTVDPATTPPLMVTTSMAANNIMAIHSINGGVPGETYTLSVAQGDQQSTTILVTCETQPQ
jgi:hypothetical protein